jgi:hypothetical protein
MDLLEHRFDLPSATIHHAAFGIATLAISITSFSKRAGFGKILKCITSQSLWANLCLTLFCIS